MRKLHIHATTDLFWRVQLGQFVKHLEVGITILRTAICLVNARYHLILVKSIPVKLKQDCPPDNGNKRWIDNNC